jgi:restriction system protein
VSLSGLGAKGLPQRCLHFITTFASTSKALETAKQSDGLRPVLIDGKALTKLMIQLNVGLRVTRTVEVERIDRDYFEDIDAE